MKTNKDFVYTGLGGFFSIILIQFLMSYLTTGNVWEWYEISNNVIPFLVFFIIVLIIIKEYNVRKINR
ncbi:hypothetical protein C7R57_09975 [Macrococcoides caseolyticum subsp. caseolyticum]|nr:hypothetical protein CD152_11290 [Macrococcus caseolyticus]RAK44818.1 hypothetical protein C7R57_09975 [Macrococcus caseolyticus subsp. caseolyticus]